MLTGIRSTRLHGAADARRTTRRIPPSRSLIICSKKSARESRRGRGAVPLFPARAVPKFYLERRSTCLRVEARRRDARHFLGRSAGGRAFRVRNGLQDQLGAVTDSFIGTKGPALMTGLLLTAKIHGAPEFNGDAMRKIRIQSRPQPRARSRPHRSNHRRHDVRSVRGKSRHRRGGRRFGLPRGKTPEN